MEQLSLFGELPPATIAIKESASRLGVSTATIRNWIKTKYLQEAGKGRITLESLEKFQEEVSGKDKLNKRANKSLKDSHDHKNIVSVFLEKKILSPSVSEKTGMEYEASLSDSYRNKEGIYYTPNEIVRHLFSVPEAETQGATFCDPCCGSGNFVIRALELGFKPENIYGYDIDPVAVEMTKARIYRATGYKSDKFVVADFLNKATLPENKKFDFIYTNPPWGKKIEKKSKKIIGSILGAGNSLDTSSLFFFACIKCLNNNGQLGLLLPESFFNIAVFETARRQALALSIERLIDYGKVFKRLVTNAQAIVLRNRTTDTFAAISCETLGGVFQRNVESFRYNPRSILNMHCNDVDSATLQHILSVKHITLKNNALWGLGIVTGNNKKCIKSSPENGYIPVFKGADIQPYFLKQPSAFIPSDMNLYQQVAPLQFYKAKRKLIYKFISSRLCFFYDDKQRFILNSANMLIPKESFPISTKILGELLSSEFMNWIFLRIFNTHKILRSDLELLPIHSQYLTNMSRFNERKYLEKLDIEKDSNGTYRIKN
ncbi:MAG: DNA methyltransferase [Desulfobacterales bacterium]|nr:MAG: DNA methyltransferase [Desulfobacterales bacterium]